MLEGPLSQRVCSTGAVGLFCCRAVVGANGVRSKQLQTTGDPRLAESTGTGTALGPGLILV